MTIETLPQGLGPLEKCIESMTSGFRKLGLSRRRSTALALVALAKGGGLSSARAGRGGGAGDRRYEAPPPALEPASLWGKGAGCGRTGAPSQGQRAERGFPPVEKPDSFF